MNESFSYYKVEKHKNICHLQRKAVSYTHLAVYKRQKLALLLFTFELSEQLREKGISVNAADPGIVSTDIITMHKMCIRDSHRWMKAFCH